MGQAFYLSSDESFARIWAKQGWHINVYDWEEEGLAIQTLEQDENWFRTIFENRNYAKDPYSHFDAIIAPIANDTIFDLVGLLTSGFVPEDICLKVLRQGPKFTQIALKSEKAVKNLHYLGSSVISGKEAEENRKKAEAMEKEFLDSIKTILGKYKEVLE